MARSVLVPPGRRIAWIRAHARPRGREGWRVVRLSQLREREIVEVATGRRLGVVGDLEIDAETGAVLALLVPGAPRLLGLFGAEEGCRIPWTDLVTIGEDVILVRLPGGGTAEQRGG